MEEKKSKLYKEIEQYLNDLDNLIDTGHFPKESVKDYTFHHKDLTLKEFVMKGREFIRKSLMSNEKREGYEIRKCANCGHEEEMYFIERWCKRCRGDYSV